MARTVREIMNPELLYVGEGARPDQTLEAILEFGVTAVPVLDAEGRPMGVTSLRDLVRSEGEALPMTSPATTIAATATVAAAAETMAAANRHHLVVVGSDGKAIGMVSTLDVLRGLVGHPATHPATFPRNEPELEIAWSSDHLLGAPSALSTVPSEPGVLVLLRGGVEQDEAIVWTEPADDVRLRLRDIASDGPALAPALAELVRSGRARFRYALVRDDAKRASVARRLQERMAHAPPPGGT
jgi:CBS domain-containing protein